MNEDHLLRRTDFAKLAGVTPTTITAACKRGRSLEPAVVGHRIDPYHPAAVQYMETAARRKAGEPVGRDQRLPPRKPKRSVTMSGLTEQEALDRLPADIRAMVDLPFRELVRMFGTDDRFVAWLKATKEIEIVREKRLKNATAEGLLVSREATRSAVIVPINTAHVKLLADGSKTIAREVHAMAAAGKPVEECEAYVRGEITAFLRPLRSKLAKALAVAARRTDTGATDGDE